ncbi:hypothetical protein BGU17_19100 [Clostridioides difficile]|uniref:hypothetical protein n=1 Tax=Clostridioides difficile TaxID=1496 RepID=UPI000BB35EFD|nr:hypothetical protein [Clostridioides difficile]PBE23030.1 hypothetical protein BGU17_19100 [Clostridioides difficile]
MNEYILISYTKGKGACDHCRRTIKNIATIKNLSLIHILNFRRTHPLHPKRTKGTGQTNRKRQQETAKEIERAYTQLKTK